jgi:hypothetical protein
VHNLLTAIGIPTEKVLGAPQGRAGGTQVLGSYAGRGEGLCYVQLHFI